MTRRTTSKYASMLNACVMAMGIATTWGVVGGWLTDLVRNTFVAKATSYDNIAIAVDGTPVISEEATVGGRIVLGRRTIDGDAWPEDYEWWLGSAYLFARAEPAGLWPRPHRWREDRIGGVSDGKQTPSAWYVIVDDKERLYFAGFDGRTKTPIGFIGRMGFCPTLPVEKERFRGIDRAFRLGTASRGYLQSGELVQHHTIFRHGESIPTWFVYVVDGDVVREVDLRKRTSKPVLELRSIESISMLGALASTVGRPDGGSEGAPSERINGSFVPAWTFISTAGQETFFRALPPTPEKRPATVDLLVARTQEQLVIFDPQQTKQWAFDLPTSLEDYGGRLIVSWPQSDQLLVQTYAGYWERGPIRKLRWISHDGTVAREERLELRGRVPQSATATAWQWAALAPIPVVWGTGLTIAEPLRYLQQNKVDSYGEGLRTAFAAGWWPFVTVIGAGGLALWFASRSHRRYFRAKRWLWLAFVFVLGPAGLLAYWIEFRRPTMEDCGGCAARVPRDRDACASCGKKFAQPSPIGTEIFAA